MSQSVKPGSHQSFFSPPDNSSLLFLFLLPFCVARHAPHPISLQTRLPRTRVLASANARFCRLLFYVGCLCRRYFVSVSPPVLRLCRLIFVTLPARTFLLFPFSRVIHLRLIHFLDLSSSRFNHRIHFCLSNLCQLSFFLPQRLNHPISLQHCECAFFLQPSLLSPPLSLFICYPFCRPIRLSRSFSPGLAVLRRLARTLRRHQAPALCGLLLRAGMLRDNRVPSPLVQPTLASHLTTSRQAAVRARPPP